MTPIIDATGIHIPTFQDIFDNLVTQYKTIYGDDIDLSQNTPDGQMLGIQAKTIIDFNEFAVSLYNSFDPDFAQGTQQDKLLKLNGLRRQEATRSTVDITMVCSTAVALPSDYKIKDALGQVWVVSEAQTIPQGTTIVTFVSEIWGNIEALPNTITEFETVVLGVESVNNILSAVPGIAEETDEEVRFKREGKLQIAAQSMVGGLNAKLLQVCDDAKVYENNTDTTDSNNIPPHAIWAICDGGSVSDIARVIAIDKGAGAGMKGNINATHEEIITLNTGEQFPYFHNVRFDRQTDTNPFIKFDVKKKTLQSIIDTDLIKKNLTSLLYGISEDVIATSLYATIYNSGDGFIASNIQLSKDNITFVQDILKADVDEKFTILDANIIITEI